jgi:hypothetical protein
MAHVTHTHVGSAESMRTTDPSRITGVRSSTASRFDGPVFMRGIGGLDWGAIIGSVCAGLGVTMMLSVLGVATGLIASDPNVDAGEATGILGAVGAWLVIALCVGSFIGSFIGGRFAQWLGRGSVVYHALTSWGIAIILTSALAALLTIGFSNSFVAADAAAQAGTSKAAANTNNTAATATDNIGGVGWGIGIGMLLTLGTAVGGWWLGSRKPLMDVEVDDADTVAVM